jgi:hypothetical protein
VVRQVYSSDVDKIHDGKVCEVLTKKELIKDKRAILFVRLFKVCAVYSIDPHMRFLLQELSVLKPLSGGGCRFQRPRFCPRSCRTWRECLDLSMQKCSPSKKRDKGAITPISLIALSPLAVALSVSEHRNI